jgi:hypothetical protein
MHQQFPKGLDARFLAGTEDRGACPVPATPHQPRWKQPLTHLASPSLPRRRVHRLRRQHLGRSPSTTRSTGRAATDLAPHGYPSNSQLGPRPWHRRRGGPRLPGPGVLPPLAPRRFRVRPARRYGLDRGTAPPGRPGGRDGPLQWPALSALLLRPRRRGACGGRRRWGPPADPCAGSRFCG